MKCNIKEEINKSQARAFELLPDIITTFGKQLHDDSYFIGADPNIILEGYDNNIDWYIQGFKYKDNKSYIIVSWSLGNADGEEIVEITNSNNSIKVTINPKLYFYIAPYEIYEAIRYLKLL